MVEMQRKNKGAPRQAPEQESPRLWEQSNDWSNPFGDGENSLKLARKKRQERKKRSTSSRRRHQMTEEEMTEMSSRADDMLDELLGEEEARKAKLNMPELQGGKESHNPFEEAEEEETPQGDEINKRDFEKLMQGKKPSTPTKTASKPVETGTNNPFEDEMDSEEDADADNEEEEEEVPRPSVRAGTSARRSGRAPPSREDPANDEDVVESSKRLLRMADQRLQYQQKSDETKKLKETITVMKRQAEAMSEQLRRAVETKCDLVLAQTEMERCHEQNLIAKDDEIRDMKLYAQELLDAQAQNDLKFMNEISVISRKLEAAQSKHKHEIDAKDFKIAQLEAKVKQLQMESGRPESVHGAFRSRFIDAANTSSNTFMAAMADVRVI
eukprot:Nitzschia sp. Nitz4//scaffold139_size61406//42766//43917//NITZ4_006463-RA/size61406-processed-gene-0.70-mRNA-1//1//CDS//3329535861//5638//frame0